jgi:hypothetical protein
MSGKNPKYWLPRDDQGRVQWPSDVQEAEKLVRRLFGWALIGTMDYWIDHATSYLTDPVQPSRMKDHQNYAAIKDKEYRDCFKSLTEPQRQMTLKLVREIVHGALFSTISDLDQFPIGSIEIDLVEGRPDGTSRRIPITRADEDLFEAFVPWVEEFSTHADRLVDDLR